MSQNSMKIAGVIAEFNPFHDGHAYLLKKAREMTGADFVVVVMSGNFVQRGTPAIMEKSLRVRAALTHGADAVFELPVRTATGSADYFAEGAVWLLSALGVTDLCFGCETDDLSTLQWIADVLAEEPAPFREELKCGLKDGLSYAAAVQRAVEKYQILASRDSGLSSAKDHAGQLRDTGYNSLKGKEEGGMSPTDQTEHLENAGSDLTSLLSLPNNLLAVSYLKALRKTGSPIRPHAILRQGAAYHAESSAPVTETFPSAAALRKLMETCTSEINLSDAGLSETDLSNESLSEADLSNEGLSGANPSDEGLSGANLSNESLSGAKLSDAGLSDKTANSDTAPLSFAALRPYLSESLFSLYQPDFGRTFPVFPDDFSLLLGKTLLDLNPDDTYFDCAPDLYRRIYNNRRSFTSFDSFCQNIHTKQFSLATAQRGILHCMLGLKANDRSILSFDGKDVLRDGDTDALSGQNRNGLHSEGRDHLRNNRNNLRPESRNKLCDENIENLRPAYLPLLGFRQSARPLLTEISRRSPLPLLSKTCEGRNLPDPQAVRQWEEIMHADALYRLVRCCRFGRDFPLPEQAQIVVDG